MAEPHFYLKDSNSSEDTLISLYWRIGSRRFVYSTGEQVRPSLWSLKKEKVLPRHPNADSLNEKLEMLKVGVVDEYQRILREKEYVQWPDLKQALDVIQGKERGGTTFFEFFDAFIEQKKKSTSFGTRSIGTYTSARSRLRDFAKAIKRKEIDFQDIDYQLWERLEEHIISGGYSANYIEKIMSRIKTVLKEAEKRGIYQNAAFKHLSINTRKEATTAIYLNKSELQRLYEIDYSQNTRLEKARDLFLVGAVTGLRYSDFTRISQNDIRLIDGMEFLDFLTKKTKKKVVIPVSKILRSILDKYNGKLPNLSQQKMNDYLKEIGRDCGFMDDKINKIITLGGNTTSNMVPRHELFTTHTARRSFATNAYLDGLDAISIMLITGHSSEKQLLEYIRVSEEENALRIAKANQQQEQGRLQSAIDSLRFLLSLDLSEEEKTVLLGLIARFS